MQRPLLAAHRNCIALTSRKQRVEAFDRCSQGLLKFASLSATQARTKVGLSSDNACAFDMPNLLASFLRSNVLNADKLPKSSFL